MMTRSHPSGAHIRFRLAVTFLLFIFLTAFISSTSAQSANIAYGDIVGGDIEPGASATWYFEGNEGDEVTIVVTSLYFESIVTLDPISITVASTEYSSFGERTLAEIIETLPYSGLYAINISGSDRIMGGDYTLQLMTRAAGDRIMEGIDAEPLAFDTPTTAAYAYFDGHFWRFDAEAGDEITITVASDDFDPEITLSYYTLLIEMQWARDSKRATNTLPLRITKTGTYIIGVGDGGTNDEGDYTITLERGFHPAEVVATWRDITFEYRRDWLITEAPDSLVISPPDSEGSLPRLHIYPPEQIAAFLGEPITDIGQLAELTFNQFAAEVGLEEAANYLPYMTYMSDRYAIMFDYRTEGAAGVQIAVELNGEIYWIVTRTRLENDERFAYYADEIIRSISTTSPPSEPVSYTMCAAADGVRLTRGDGYIYQPEVNYNRACEDSAVPEAIVPTPVTSESVERTCFASAANAINMRMGPGTDFEVAGQLTADELVIGQQAGNSGAVWYQLSSGFWVREDVVDLRGDCANIPFFNAQSSSAESSFVAASVRVNRPDSYDAARQVASIWTLNEFRDMTAPGTQTYELHVLPGSSYRLSFTWCADSAARLREILGPLTVRFYVSGVELVASQILQTDRTNCRIWDSVLSGWQSGETIFVDLQYTLASPIFDGTATYQAGSYRHEITITVG